ncbi:MAG: pilin [Sulfuricellaceae bacterium]|nr:pilin [Sulfuricellaceae bacterium]
MLIRQDKGFSAMEMMVVLAVIAILAAMSIPSFTGRIIREHIVTAIPLADIAKEPIAAYWKLTQTLPADNTETGLPVPEKIVSNMISSLVVEQGVINMTFGNNSNKLLRGKILSIRPAVIEDSPVVPVAWVCGNAAVPDKMVVKGGNKTNIEDIYLPHGCRNTQAAK